MKVPAFGGMKSGSGLGRCFGFRAKFSASSFGTASSGYKKETNIFTIQSQPECI